MKVARDVLGGELGPSEGVRGALRAVEKKYIAASDLILVGRQDEIVKALTEAGKPADTFPIVHAQDFVGMDESPVEALRKKPDNSLSRCVKLLKEGQAQ